MSFADSDSPPPPAGPEIQRGVRSAILEIFREAYGPLTPTRIWAALCRHQGYGDLTDAARDIEDRWSKTAAVVFADTIRRDPDANRLLPQPKFDPFAKPALLGMPAPLFLTAVEQGLAVLKPSASENKATNQGRLRAAGAIVHGVNGLFDRRGVHYRFNGIQAEWHGDAGVFRQLVHPALGALSDDRLHGARVEYEAAVSHIRTGTNKALEDAIDEAAKAVESAMKVLLAGKSVTLSGTEAARNLWDRLKNESVVPPHMEWVVLSPSRIRNRLGGHGAGASPREIPVAEATACVHAAAAAIAYLAALLPPDSAA